MKDLKIDKKIKFEGCGVCGGKLVFIRGRHPGQDMRQICPTCAYERLEQIHDMTSPRYGQAEGAPF